MLAVDDPCRSRDVSDRKSALEAVRVRADELSHTFEHFCFERVDSLMRHERVKQGTTMHALRRLHADTSVWKRRCRATTHAVSARRKHCHMRIFALAMRSPRGYSDVPTEAIVRIR